MRVARNVYRYRDAELMRLGLPDAGSLPPPPPPTSPPGNDAVGTSDNEDTTSELNLGSNGANDVMTVPVD